MINASIPLQAQAPQVQDPLAQLARVAGLKNALQQSQAADMELREKQRALDDQQILRQAYAEAKGDLDQVSTLVAGKVSPSALMSIQKAAQEIRRTFAQTAEAELRAYKARSEVLGSEIGSILSAPSEQRAALYQQRRAALIAEGALSPETPEQYPGDEALQQFQALGLSAKDQIDVEFRRRDDARKKTESDAKLPGVKADAAAKVRSDAASTLAAASNAAEYTRRYDALPSDQQQLFPKPEAWDAKTTPRAVRQVGMTPSQQASALQGEERNRIAARREGRVASQGGGTRASNAQKAAAERWMQAQLGRVEKQLKEALVEAGPTGPEHEAAVASAEAEKLDIYNSYRRQIGEDEVGVLPASWGAGAPAKAGGAAKPTAKGQPASGRIAVGQEVVYQGKRYRVKGITGGQADLEEIR